MPSFDDLVHELEIQAAITKDFAALNKRNPQGARALLAQLVAVVGPVAQSDMGVSDRAVPKGSVKGKVIAAFLRNGNAPRNKKDLAGEAGVNPGSLHSLLYADSTSEVERVPNPDGGREVAWRLKPTVFEEMKRTGGTLM